MAFVKTLIANDSGDELVVHRGGGGCLGGPMQLLLFMDTRVSLAVEPLDDLRRTFFFVK